MQVHAGGDKGPRHEQGLESVERYRRVYTTLGLRVVTYGAGMDPESWGGRQLRMRFTKMQPLRC